MPTPCYRACGRPAEINDGDDAMGEPVCCACYEATVSNQEDQPIAAQQAAATPVTFQQDLTPSRWTGRAFKLIDSEPRTIEELAEILRIPEPIVHEAVMILLDNNNVTFSDGRWTS